MFRDWLALKANIVTSACNEMLLKTPCKCANMSVMQMYNMCNVMISAGGDDGGVAPEAAQQHQS